MWTLRPPKQEEFWLHTLCTNIYRRSTGYWGDSCTSEYESAGSAVVLVRNVMGFLVGNINGVVLVVGFLGRLENSAGF